jgi:hypothetical protein
MRVSSLIVFVAFLPSVLPAKEPPVTVKGLGRTLIWA